MARSGSLPEVVQGLPSIPEMVARSAHRWPQRPALRQRTPEWSLTYRELDELVTGLARGVKALGLKRGERCAILGPNSIHWGVAYLAVQRAGGVCVPLDSLLSENELRLLLADAKVRLAFVAPRFLDCVLETHRGFPGPKAVVCLGPETDGGLPSGVMGFHEVLDLGNRCREGPRPAAPDDLAAIIYTSGTTGNPKGVMLTHRNIVSDALACTRAVEIGQERFISVLPLHHTFEFTAGFVLPLMTGCSVTYARSLKSRYIIEDIRASQATVMLGVPLLFQKMMEGILRRVEKAPLSRRMAFKAAMTAVRAGERVGNPWLGRRLFRRLREQAGLGSLRMLIAGGAPLPARIPRFFRRLGLLMLQGYGLTEASPVLTLNPPDAPKDESIGKPLPGVEVRILHPDEDGVGELAFRGPMVMQGYYNNEEATRQVLTDDGFLRTGDLGYQDREGYLYICGRAKNLIVTPAGKNVYPEEIEAELNQSPYILESMVYGRPLQGGGEEVCALIVPDYETIGEMVGKGHLGEETVRGLMEKEVRRLNRRLASYKRIKEFTLRDEELIKTSTKKIKRHMAPVR